MSIVPVPSLPTDSELQAIPDALCDLPRWVCWCVRKLKDRPTKVPIDAKSGRNASSVDPKTWATFEQAVEHARQTGNRGIGFVLANDDDIVGVDLDKCRDPIDGAVEPWAQEVIKGIDSYAELSPSGTGVHVIARGTLPPGRRKSGGIEMYEHARFFTVTGRALSGTSCRIEERAGQLADLHRRTFGAEARLVGSGDNPPGRLPAGGNQDAQELIAKLRARGDRRFTHLFGGSHSDYSSRSEADLALCGIVVRLGKVEDASLVDAVFRKSGLFRAKWDEPHGEKTYGEMTIAKAMESACKNRERAAAVAAIARDHLELIENQGSVELVYDPAFLDACVELHERDRTSFHQLADRLKKQRLFGSWRREVTDRIRRRQLERRFRSSNLPQIQVNDQPLNQMVSQALRAIRRANAQGDAPIVYRSGSRLVRLSEDERRLESINATAMKGYLSHAANWYRTTRSAVVDVKPDPDVAHQLIEFRDEMLPEVNASISAPRFGSNGELITQPGYHAEHKLYFAHDGLVVDDLPMEPTALDVEQAREVDTNPARLSVRQRSR